MASVFATACVDLRMVCLCQAAGKGIFGLVQCQGRTASKRDLPNGFRWRTRRGHR